MLTLYRRHSADCPKKDQRYWRRCKCPMWAQGTVEGIPLHRSLKTRSWERATEIARKMESGEKEQVSVREAGRQFNADAERRGLSRSQREKYRLLVREIEAFAEASKVWNVAEFDVAKVREYVTTWKLAPITTAKKLERLRSFFRFCMDSGWITRNPAKVVKAPRVKPNPTLPFSNEEIERMLVVADPRMKSLILVLIYSGLRIGDAVQLTVDKVRDGKIFLYSQKTGTPVRVPVPQFVIDSLPEPRGGYYFLLAESTRKESMYERWREKFMEMLATAKIENGHFHRFRDTASVRWLLAGIPIDQVSILLAHSDTRVTLKHYAPFVKERQVRLEELVRASWK